MSALKRLKSHLTSPAKQNQIASRTRSQKLRARDEENDEPTMPPPEKKSFSGLAAPKFTTPIPSTQQKAGLSSQPTAGTSQPPAAAASQSPAAAASQPPVGSNKWAKVQNKKAKKNEKNRERKKKRATQGPLHPYAIKIWADADGEPLSLETWRDLIARTKANLVQMILELIEKKIPINTMAVDEYKFVEHKVMQDGVFQKTSHLPPQQRKGHGLILSFTKEGKELAERAFRATGIDPSNNQPNIGIQAAPVDTRAIYTFAVGKYDWPSLEKDGAIWHIIHHTYPDVIPNFHQNEIKHTSTASFSPEVLIAAVATNQEWEKALDSLNGVLRLPTGTVRMKKRRKGASPPEDDPQSDGEMN